VTFAIDIPWVVGFLLLMFLMGGVMGACVSLSLYLWPPQRDDH